MRGLVKAYSGSPLIRPPLKHRKSGYIREMVFDKGDKMEINVLQMDLEKWPLLRGWPLVREGPYKRGTTVLVVCHHVLNLTRS